MEVHTWQEEWINSKDETIHILLEYAFPADGPKDFNNLYVNITLFGKDSWKQVFIPQYKKLHPDEFEGPAPTLKK